MKLTETIAAIDRNPEMEQSLEAIKKFSVRGMKQKRWFVSDKKSESTKLKVTSYSGKARRH